MLTRRDFLRAAGRATLAAPLATAACRPKEDGRTHLRYMAWGNVEQLATEQRVLDRFHEQNPDIRVTLFKVPGQAYRQKMILMLASRTAPDVIRVDQWDFPQLVRRDYFRDITDMVKGDAEFDYEDHFPQANEECLHEGRVKGVNVLFGGQIVYYNRSLMQKAGLEDPYQVWKRGDWTWDRFREYAIALTRREGSRPVQFGFQIPPFVNYTPLIWGYGGDLLTTDRKRCVMDSDETIEAYRFLLGLRWKDRCCPTPAQGAQSAFAFEGGRLGMSFDWMGMSPRYREAAKHFDWDICPLPRGPAGAGTVVKGNQLTMNRLTRFPEAAWRLMRHIGSRETEMYLYGQLRRCTATRPSVARDPEFLRADLPPRHTDVFTDTIPGGRRMPIDHRWQEWSTVRDRYLEQLLSGASIDTPGVLRELSRECTKVLQDQEGF